jgi:hypothetical protein
MMARWEGSDFQSGRESSRNLTSARLKVGPFPVLRHNQFSAASESRFSIQIPGVRFSNPHADG